MLSLSGQIIFLKIRRIFELLMFILCIVLISTAFYFKWSKTQHDDIAFNHSNFQGMEFSKKEIAGRPDLAKYIHLDLKGAPPKANEFYESFFQFLEKLQMGIKGVLIEYEDTLPLEGNLINVPHRNAYTKSDIKLIQDAARKHHLEVIPLIQTFGHLEWILKLKEYRSLRDNRNLPTVISPCLNTTYILLEDLLHQTLDLHPDSNIIHIGCDEVVLTNSRKQCQTTSMTTFERYINHIQRVVSIVRQIRPGIRVLIWDDILRSDQIIDNEQLLDPIKGLVEPVSWNYFPKFNEKYQSSSVWNIYPKFFTNTWAASAFKGGLHRFSMITNTTHHVLNNRQWLEFIGGKKDLFSAIILTGWSRFDHFMPLCDLFPTAYPSLIHSLDILNTNQFRVDESMKDCDQLMGLMNKETVLCELLPGQPILSSISSLSSLLPEIQSRIKLLNTVAPEYNRQHLFVRRHELDIFLWGLRALQTNFLRIKKKLNLHLIDLYSEDVVNEWLELYVTPIEKQINTTFLDFLPVCNMTIWPRRPLV